MKTIITIACCLFMMNTFAQSAFGSIKGKIIDAMTQEAIPFTNVYVMSNGNAVGSTTDIDGKFHIKPLGTGTYDLIISNIEFGKKTISKVVVNSDQISLLGNLEVSKGNEITEMKVNGNKLINPEETSLVTISAEQIKNSPLRTNIVKMIGGGNSNVQVSEDGNEVYFRGARNGDVLYIVDGVKLLSGKPVIPSAGINRLSVYTGGVPAKYGDTMGGVIVVDTKSYFDMYYASLRNQ